MVYTPAYEVAGVNREQVESVIPLIPAGRLGLESDIAAAIVFLASDDASFVNGANLVVDCGQTEIV
ncbi:SDR family oxidoreductase [Streptomyces sp. NBC_00287]|uniref:SDR family oxidoreductase n=1 Tax=Streptomyces sp. NBC_00287 TaxID=2975702 RepID=UPI002E2D2A44|nr:SDR family oxidoreductase [Streptomyces sp. NBC_00287]